jgi:peptidoglycan/LPS O-acetylase OafA/YrhL
MNNSPNVSSANSLHEDRILALDGVRGLAILSVLICHAANSIPFTTEIIKFFKALASFGTFGVDLFFVLSGYLITKILLHNYDSINLLRVFWVRRIARIAPLYIAFLLVMFSFCWLFLPSNLPNPPWWSYLLYLQNFYLASGMPADSFGFDITWSLVIEEHFYLLFPVVIAVSSKKYHLPLMLLFCVVGLPSRLFLHPWLEARYHFVHLDSLFLTGRIDELAIGGLLSLCYERKYFFYKWLFTPKTFFVLWSCVGFMYVTKYHDNFVTGLAGCATIGCALSDDWPTFRQFLESSLLRFFGRISYALYLFHTPLFWFVENKTTGYISFLFLFISAVIAVILSFVSTYYFEEPIQKKFKRIKYISSKNLLL